MSRGGNCWLALALVTLAVGLRVNSLLGQFGTGVVTYPFSETLVNQMIGLEAVSLLVVSWSIVSVCSSIVLTKRVSRR